jgi:hypothetical protein
MRLGEHYAGEKNLACPVCGEDYVHPVGVMVSPLRGREVVYINADGVHIEEFDMARRVRGVEIVSTFVCEGGHQWEEARRFHKGITLHEVRHTATYDVADELFPGTIWRS